MATQKITTDLHCRQARPGQRVGGADTPGLRLRVYPSGVKSWLYRYRVPVPDSDGDPVMVGAPATYDDMAAARETLIKALRNELSPHEREFLLSIKAAEPRWELMDLLGIETLSAVQWKLANIEKMKPAKRREAYERLRAILEQ